MTGTEQSVGKCELQVPFGDCTDSRSPCSVLPEPGTGALPCRCSFLSLECSAPFSVFIQVQFVSVSRGSCLQTKKPYLPLLSSKRKVPRGSVTERGPGGWRWTVRWKPRRSPERLGPHLRNHLLARLHPSCNLPDRQVGPIWGHWFHGQSLFAEPLAGLLAARSQCEIADNPWALAEES